ncbi:Gamma-aminobutyric acid receptor subunit beta-1-like 2 [Homarus americanus]|uniref:Gamma-aminobutyric acid receptor subunit beta-1-like 2 n=1 Tax=Homarus americanus TaxID=6706 RepID=A0A8J5K8P0_HOMAM|nr:Gamma-aminobutyric acid receptor subunit beta-1-like 2 [Homarus americanus]
MWACLAYPRVRARQDREDSRAGVVVDGGGNRNTSNLPLSLSSMSLTMMDSRVVLAAFTSTLLLYACVGGVTVLRFQEDGVATNDSIAVYKGDLSRTRHLYSFTFCMRFKVFFLHQRGTIFFLYDSVQGRYWMLRGEVWVDKVRVAISHTWHFMPLDQQLWAFRWYHLCFTHNHETYLIQTFLDGVMVRNSSYNVNRPAFGDYAAVGNGQATEESYSGDITQVNVWDRIMSDEEIRKMAHCQIDPKGNFISWEGGWTLNNVSSYEMSLSEICEQEVGNIYFWFPEVTDDTAQYICEALGTHLPHITSLQDAEYLYQLSETMWPETDHCPVYIWSPLNDKKEENVWVASYDKNYIDNTTYWSPDEPNGYRYENCAAVRRDGLIDDDCAWYRCALCTFTQPQRFSFLGTCEPELRNVYFVAYQEEYGGLIFRSYGSYHIKKENGTWIYVDTVQGYNIARMEAFDPEFPMGRRWWQLEREVCGQVSGGRRRMLLTPCLYQHYTCDDGTCIPHHYRCDLKYDCRDQSDELDCELILFPKDYHQHLPPRVPGKEDSKLPVVIKVIVKSIDVQTVEMAMKLSYEIEMSWYDNRLQYYNLKSNDSLNSPRLDTMMKLWSPLVKLLNTDTIDQSLLAFDATTLVKRLTKPLWRDEGAAGEVDIYSGEENPLSVSRKYSTKYACQFDLTLYPFDSQHCDIHLQIVSGQVSFLDVHPDSVVVYLGSQVLNEYKIGDVKVLLEKEYMPGEARVRVPMTRLYGNSILTIYIPSLILMIISYLTLFFRTSIFDVRVMVALTALLVLATLFAQASSSLPKTSYFKMVDIWLLFCVGITFLVIIFHILIDNRLFSQAKKTQVKPFGKSDSFVDDESVGLRGRFRWSPNISVEQMVLLAKASVFLLIICFIIGYLVYIVR